MKSKRFGLSLFSGAGGMDVGFSNAGFNILWANEIDKDACETYEANHSKNILRRGDIREVVQELSIYEGVDILFGGPPCQGFSVAGKMDPNDERSTLIWSFLKAVEIVRPKIFVCENVKALAKLDKWKLVRGKFMLISEEIGYSCYPYLLNSSRFGVPQNRERVFFVGFRDKKINPQKMLLRIEAQEKPSRSIREAISHLGPAGTPKNPLTCTARITLAEKPVMRKSPYAGMLFNGLGRPIYLEGPSATLPASMGGNKTPIVDESLLYNLSEDNWVVDYHKGLLDKQITPRFAETPSRLRRLTIKEAALIQTFPQEYVFHGSKTSIYKQIGNAVPCLMAEAVAKAVIEELEDVHAPIKKEIYQLSLAL